VNNKKQHQHWSSVILVSLLLLSPFSQAEEDNPISAIGKFASVGEVGAKQLTLTMVEAHEECLTASSDGAVIVDEANAYDTDYHDKYNICMSQYVPFKEMGAGSAGLCGGSAISWGECSASLPASASGTILSVKNSVNVTDFEGFASFQCNGGVWEYQSGGCSRAVHACEANQVVNWPVTSPLWADEAAGTPYVDKYGQFRHSPKSRCVAKMPYALSGTQIATTPTTPEMSDPTRYVMSNISPQRCFDSEWISDASAGNAECTYVAKTCAAKSYDYNGCGYTLPAAGHDTIHIAKNPSPSNSLGNVEAYCWDGEWEIKAQSCQVSCVQNFQAYSWDSDPSTRACQHSASTGSGRTTPGLSELLSNETDGMNGSVSYFCNDGKWEKNSEYCEPKGCDTLAALDWLGVDGAICHHNGVVSQSWTHNDSYSEDSENGPFVGQGSAFYRCEFGDMKNLGTTCSTFDDGSNPTLCLSKGGLAAEGMASDYCADHPDTVKNVGGIACCDENMCYEQ